MRSSCLIYAHMRRSNERETVTTCDIVGVSQQDPAAQSRRKIVVAGHTKLGRTAQHILCPVNEVDPLITDAGAPKRALSALRRKGVEVVTA